MQAPGVGRAGVSEVPSRVSIPCLFLSLMDLPAVLGASCLWVHLSDPSLSKPGTCPVCLCVSSSLLRKTLVYWVRAHCNDLLLN